MDNSPETYVLVLARSDTKQIQVLAKLGPTPVFF
jgi:hypothetical protein